MQRIKDRRQERIYHAYITDALQAIAHNTAHALREGGRILPKRYIDILEPGPTDTRTGSEIAAGVIGRLRGEGS